MKREATTAELGTKSKKAFRPNPKIESQTKMIINKKADLDILPNPEISENDKKSYRYVKL